MHGLDKNPNCSCVEIIYHKNRIGRSNEKEWNSHEMKKNLCATIQNKKNVRMQAHYKKPFNLFYDKKRPTRKNKWNPRPQHACVRRRVDMIQKVLPGGYILLQFVMLCNQVNSRYVCLFLRNTTRNIQMQIIGIKSGQKGQNDLRESFRSCVVDWIIFGICNFRTKCRWSFLSNLASAFLSTFLSMLESHNAPNFQPGKWNNKEES